MCSVEPCHPLVLCLFLKAEQWKRTFKLWAKKEERRAWEKNALLVKIHYTNLGASGLTSFTSHNCLLLTSQFGLLAQFTRGLTFKELSVVLLFIYHLSHHALFIFILFKSLRQHFSGFSPLQDLTITNRHCCFDCCRQSTENSA